MCYVWFSKIINVIVTSLIENRRGVVEKLPKITIFADIDIW